MTTGVRVLETVHVIVLGVWFGVLGMTAAVAAIIFPAMRSLEPAFGQFSRYEGAHADLGAGFIQARVFAAADMVQFAAALLAMLNLTGAMVLQRNLKSMWTMIRCVLLACAVAMLSYHLFILAPRMDSNARVYWEAAAAGESDRAHESHEAFMRDHPAATRTMMFLGVFVAGTLFASTWSLSGERAAKRRGEGSRL
ncbi:MAG: hypothetical protein KF757_12595 [Phycisphaeraceae bacterium]|nr:hypothetical protein [Phycisphaeraceae bacterium]MCW5762553.1 hypothetical protein [Phycisphaeraceae bacterium]